jgi:hypothetical protein
LPAAILTAVLAFAAAQAEEVGRAYAREGAALRASASPSSGVVRHLVEGDELVPVSVEPDEMALRPQTLPAGWLAFSTVELDSQRVFVGFLPASEVSAHGPDPARRSLVVRREAQRTIARLSSLAGQFAALKDKRDLPALAALMDSQITPRLQDAQDLIGKLRDLGDPQAPALAKELAKQSARFKP